MSRVITLPPEGFEADGAKPGGWWHTGEDGRIVCDLCPRACQLPAGARGFCFVRENRDGRMVLGTYGRSTGFCVDPIEKKPLNHFLPGTSVLSFGTAGCNLGCQFCQNWSISKSREIASLSESATPEAVAAAAQRLGCRSVAFTYNDPVIWAEYAIDVAAACHAVGVQTVAVTAGYITPAARGPFFAAMDATNVDLKAFTEEFYQRLTLAHLRPVLDTLQWLRTETDVWLEITNLVIPRANDGLDKLGRMCDWILSELGDDVPVHFTAFHPDFRLRDRERTPHDTLRAAHDIARRAGLKYAYVGHVVDVAHVRVLQAGPARDVVGRAEGVVRRALAVAQAEVGVERGEVHRHVVTELGQDPVAHPAELVQPVVRARDDEIRDLEPDVRLGPQPLQRVEHRPQMRERQSLIELLGERLEVHVGGVHRGEERPARRRRDVAGGDRHRLHAHRVARRGHVDRVLGPDDRVVVGERDAPAAESLRRRRHRLRRCRLAERRDLARFGDRPVLAELAAEITSSGPKESTLVPGRK